MGDNKQAEKYVEWWVDQYRSSMLTLQGYADSEYRHMAADRILCNILALYGHHDIVEMFEEMEKT